MFNISHLLSLFLLFFLPISNAVATNTAPSLCTIPRTIQANKWVQIGVPCEAPAGQKTVADIFSDDNSGAYDIDWVLFSFNPVTNAYEKPALTDVVEVGKGYWFISFNQITTLKMPQGSQSVIPQSFAQCSTTSCYESILVTTGSDQYQMLANPFDYSINGSNLRVNTGPLVGLTLAEAETNGILTNKLWSYNGSSYEELQNQVILPWTGFWVKTLSSASFNPAPTLLFPTNNVSVSAPITREQLKVMIRNGADVTQVNTSNITDMSFMFEGEASFNQNICNWDVRNVTNMRGMFIGAKSFNQDISQWNVGYVINMAQMFQGAKSFNQDIGQWNVGNVIHMANMFSGATSFNQGISQWNVGNVAGMYKMFYDATSFNQDISQWNVSKASNMGHMFHQAISFNQNISQWNVGNVKLMNNMFRQTISFNQNISQWNVGNVGSMKAMFMGAKSFTNQNLSGWNVSNIVDHSSFFFGAGSGNIEPVWP
ncbi:MAG: DUF285 domain-containing protein [Methylococcales bacterium]|nr:DUF285 domain-containing protein [Methylococcales bacterium]